MHDRSRTSREIVESVELIPLRQIYLKLKDRKGSGIALRQMLVCNRHQTVTRECQTYLSPGIRCPICRRVIYWEKMFGVGTRRLSPNYWAVLRCSSHCCSAHGSILYLRQHSAPFCPLRVHFFFFNLAARHFFTSLFLFLPMKHFVQTGVVDPPGGTGEQTPATVKHGAGKLRH